MTSAVFDALKEIVLAKYEVDGSIQERVTFELDLVPQLVNAERMYLYKSTAFWSQVKTAGSAVYANRHYLGELRKTNDERLAKDQENGPTIVGDVIVHPSARIDPSAKLGPNVSIGSNVKIQAGARVKDAIILDNVELAVRRSKKPLECSRAYWPNVSDEPDTYLKGWRALGEGC
eukprot:TRINITY_DN8729_c0_g1_i1.p3 TRINITY_DN8729_c0_g1~~TRINITY_DN8729_c0_g1_i1.p3  ORF type:complete len:175 (+),score=31.77 TRINITY_DN8729_c0_g1_i1:860-1384(+)